MAGRRTRIFKSRPVNGRPGRKPCHGTGAEEHRPFDRAPGAHHRAPRAQLHRAGKDRRLPGARRPPRPRRLLPRRSARWTASAARPMADDTIFRIYSMTKPITSVALMTLYERGHFQLNDPVHRFIPEWRDHARLRVGRRRRAWRPTRRDRPITLRHMLSHTGGLTYGAALVALGAPDSGHPGGRGLRRRSASGAAAARRCDAFIEKLGERAAALRARRALDVLALDRRLRRTWWRRSPGKRFDRYLQETSSARSA